MASFRDHKTNNTNPPLRPRKFASFMSLRDQSSHGSNLNDFQRIESHTSPESANEQELAWPTDPERDALLGMDVLMRAHLALCNELDVSFRQGMVQCLREAEQSIFTIHASGSEASLKRTYQSFAHKRKITRLEKIINRYPLSPSTCENDGEREPENTRSRLQFIPCHEGCLLSRMPSTWINTAIDALQITQSPLPSPSPSPSSPSFNLTPVPQVPLVDPDTNSSFDPTSEKSLIGPEPEPDLEPDSESMFQHDARSVISTTGESHMERRLLKEDEEKVYYSEFLEMCYLYTWL
ncbi:hypothetical protein VKT23_002483 [Stygiomarasmius scandens]|uniref:Uncharacterized protein n=1 Tax=Marasmiellus scandens TaxID=2682957 RepID=A0ABR1K3G1_9AGAR